MSLSPKQIRYLYAIGAFKKKSSSASFAKTREMSGTGRQTLREIGKVGAKLAVKQISSTHMLKIGNELYPIQKDPNHSVYPIIGGKRVSSRDFPPGKVSLVRIRSLHAEKSSGPKAQPEVIRSGTIKTESDYQSALAILESGRFDKDLSEITHNSPIGPHWKMLIDSYDESQSGKNWFSMEIEGKMREQIISLSQRKADLIGQKIQQLGSKPQGYFDYSLTAAASQLIREAFGQKKSGTTIVAVQSFGGRDKQLVEHVVGTLNNFIDPLMTKNSLNVKAVRPSSSSQKRAYARVEEGQIALPPDGDGPTVAHEIGHILERSSFLHEYHSAGFVRKYADTSREVPLSQLTGNPLYRDDEVAYRPKPNVSIPTPYVLKTYRGTENTEVLSTGLEMLYGDPVRLAWHPELFRDALAATMFPITRKR